MAKSKKASKVASIFNKANLLILAGIGAGIYGAYNVSRSGVFCPSCIIIPALFIGSGIYLIVKNKK